MGFRNGSPCAEENVRSDKIKNPIQAKLFIYAAHGRLHPAVCSRVHLLQAPIKQTIESNQIQAGMGSQGVTGRKPRYFVISFGWSQIKDMIFALMVAMKQ